MPELPEVETVRRGLATVLTGARVAKVEQRRGDLRFPFPERFAERLKGRRVESLDRRAKYLLARLDSGEVLVMHLGMTGRFTIEAANGVAHEIGEFTHEAATAPKHEHLVFSLEGGAKVRYADARRFGYMTLIPEAELAAHPLFRNLGKEPLGDDFTAEWLASRLKGKTASIKAALMDQRLIAGLGNIYVCEALHRARISPARFAGTLMTANGRPSPKTTTLVAAVKAVLLEAIAAGGSSLRDYAHADGSLGRFQHDFCVYGREGESCRRKGCAGIVRRIVQTGRSTFYCPVCQR